MLKYHPLTGHFTVEYVVGETLTSFVLDRNSSIIVGKGTAIYEEAAFNNNNYEINGTVKAGNDWLQAGIQLNGDSSHLHVGKTGSLDGYTGAAIGGPYETVFNEGHIHGSGYGLYMTGYSTAENSGSIIGEYAVMTGDESVSVTNNLHGVLSGGITAVAFGGLNTHNSLMNFGLVKGGQYAVTGYDGIETITNRGTIKGTISLKGGDDVFDNRHGKVDHAIDGGKGNDTLIVDDASTKLHELAGEGTDTVKSSVSYTLSANVETLRLLGDHDIKGTGNGGANSIFGNSGDNKLIGNGGNDVLNGMRGDDVLTGGSGADVFLFANKTGHDVITDFKHGVDHVDLSGIDGILDFDEMMAHHVKTSGQDLIIQSGQDSIRLEHVAKADLDFHDFYY